MQYFPIYGWVSRGWCWGDRSFFDPKSRPNHGVCGGGGMCFVIMTDLVGNRASLGTLAPNVGRDFGRKIASDF